MHIRCHLHMQPQVARVNAYNSGCLVILAFPYFFTSLFILLYVKSLTISAHETNLFIWYCFVIRSNKLGCMHSIDNHLHRA